MTQTPEAQAQRLVELALVGLTCAAVLGLARLFDAASFFVAVLAFAVLGHGLAWLCRRRGLGGAATTAVGVAGLVLGVSWVLVPGTTAWLLPTPASLAEVGDRLSGAWDVFSAVRAPAPVHPGLVLAAAMATYVIAWVADTAAFRAGAAIEAAVPATSLFLFGAALGAPPLRAPTTAVFLCAALGYWLSVRAWRSTTSPAWAGQHGSGAAALLGSGTRLAGVAVVGALVVGPLVPGAGSSALVPWRASDRDDGTRLTVSPLVDIRARIVDQADTEVFTVRANTRSYWRLTALDRFDGRIWRSEGSFRAAERELREPGDAPLEPGSTLVDQEVQVLGLDSVWLPAAYRPAAFDGDGADVGVDQESGTLIVGRDQRTEGLRYRVQSELRTRSEDELRTLPAAPPPEERYTDLPDTFSPAARRLALAITAGAATAYDQARALQDHFRSGAYRYDTSVEAGHGEDELERFLLATRAGYCEQFAGAYAALARAVGLPARVAVGFTPGELQADGSYHVRGLHGHAWPEVYLGAAGWVPFEPTPGRGIPGGEAYTGVREQQEGSDGQTAGSTTTSTTSTTAPAGATTSAPPGRPFEDPAAVGADEADDASPWPGRLARAALALLLAGAAWAALVTGATWTRRSRRRRSARGTSDRVLVAWDEVIEALAAAGVPRRPAETPVEYAARAAGTAGVDPQRLRGLAGLATEAGWADAPVADERAARAVADAAVLESGLRSTRTRAERLLDAVDPRPLLPRRAGRVQIRAVATAPVGGGPTPRA